MNNIANHRLPCYFKRVEVLIKLTIMKTSETKSSFLCFSPEAQYIPATLLLSNGIAESIGNENNSGKVVPMSLGNRSCLNGAPDIAHRFSEASVEDELQLSSRCSTDHNLKTVATGLEPQNLEIRERENDHIAECSGQDVLSDGSSGEVDVPAFQITEFFSIFREGQGRDLLKRKQIRKLLQSESVQDLEGVGSNALTADKQTKSDKIVVRVGVDPVDGRKSPSAGRSGMWNCFSEPDSFSATLSGPLTFSGPMSFSGNSGHVLYSGSVSHRSDSSTASSHSFAFPILPCEWNSSPVKMSKPETKSVQRPWTQCLHSIFCCAFK